MSAVDKCVRDPIWPSDSYTPSSYLNQITTDPSIDSQLFQDCNSISNYFSFNDSLPVSDDFPCLATEPSQNSVNYESDISQPVLYQNVSSPAVTAGPPDRTRTITELSSGNTNSHIRYTTSPLPQSPSQDMSRAQMFAPRNVIPHHDPLPPLTTNAEYNYHLALPSIDLPNQLPSDLEDLVRGPAQDGQQRFIYNPSDSPSPRTTCPPLESPNTPHLIPLSDHSRRRSVRLRGQSSPVHVKRQHFVSTTRPYAREKRPRRIRGLTDLDVMPPFTLSHRGNEPSEIRTVYMQTNTASKPNSGYSSPPALISDEQAQNEKRQPFVKIVEQPQQKALRFRYICEGRSAGSIPGVNSTPENKTFPTIRICNYKGAAQVVVSCVTVDDPHRPHPHNLVGKEGCSDGICRIRVSSESMECSFSNLGIQCVKKKDVIDALRKREKRQIDPFATGFAHRNQPQNIDLNAVRLCFQVFLEGPEPGCFGYALTPIVSDPIYDKKATSDLTICRLSDCTSSVTGGKEIILLCDKVNKDDIQVRFFEVRNKCLYWEGYGDFQASDVHKQMAITFRTPKYLSVDLKDPVTVYIELVQPSDRTRSDPRPFQYLPVETDYVRNKMNKVCNPSIKEDLCSLLGDVAQYLSIPEGKSSMPEDPFSQCY